MLVLKVNNSKVKSVEPLKKRTSFLESITTSAVEEANMKNRKRQGSDSESKYLSLLVDCEVTFIPIIITVVKTKKSKSSGSSVGKKAEKKVTMIVTVSTLATLSYRFNKV